MLLCLQVLGLNRAIYALKRVRFQNKDQEVRLKRLHCELHRVACRSLNCVCMRLPVLWSNRTSLLKHHAVTDIRYKRHNSQAVKGFIDEIGLLRTLRGKPNIIQLIDAQVRARHPLTKDVTQPCPLSAAFGLALPLIPLPSPFSTPSS
mgnify:CR=1 FL=1